jgi:RNase P/RNase MRP subunit p29
MSREEPRPGPSPLAGELIGAPLHIDAAPGLQPLPLEATIVDETLSTFLLRREPTGRLLRVQKRGLTGRILLDGREIPLSGEPLRVRPEERTKRLALRPRGRSS